MSNLSKMAALCAASSSDIKAIENKLSRDIDLYYTDCQENCMERGGEEFSPTFYQYCRMRDQDEAVCESSIPRESRISDEHDYYEVDR